MSPRFLCRIQASLQGEEPLALGFTVAVPGGALVVPLDRTRHLAEVIHQGGHEQVEPEEEGYDDHNPWNRALTLLLLYTGSFSSPD